MKQKYSQVFLKEKLDKLRKKLGRYNLSQRYYRDTLNNKEHNQINNVFKNFKNKTVLDVGCHIGYYSVLISSFADNVIGIDVSEKEIKRANYFKKIIDSKNIEFKFYSAFDLDEEFMEKNKINAVFFHKMSEPRKNKKLRMKKTWSTDKFRKVFFLFEKYCDIIVCNDKEKIAFFLEKKGLNIEKFPSYRSNFLYVIKKDRRKVI